MASRDASTAVQLSLFEVTPQAQHAAQGPHRVPPRSCGSNVERDLESAPQGCPLGRNRCIAHPHDCELWQYFCVPQ